MTQGAELATAWVRLVPSVEGLQRNLAEAFSPVEGEAEQTGKRAGGKMSAGLKAGAALAAAGVVAGFAGLYQIGATMDDVTDTIRVGTGAQGEALAGLTESAKNVASQVPAEFQKVGTTIADLNTRLGLSGSTLETVASQYLEAGRILGQDVDIQSTSAAFSAFRIEGDAVSGAMDTLFQVSQATGVGMNELAAGVQANAPALQNLGFGFEDTVALVGSLDKAGLNANAVMASMSKGLVTLARDGEQPQEAFKRVTGELQSFIDKGDTASALDLASQVFGTRGASQFVGALQSGALNMEDLMAATGATGDTILGVGEETQDFAETWQILMNKATLAIEPLATAIFTGLGDALSGMMPFLTEFGSWLSENLWVFGAVAVVIAVPLVAAFVAWTASIWASTVALLANPLTWVVLAIVALIAAVVLLVMNWDAVVAWITEIWAGFIAWITTVIDGFVVWWNGLWEGFGAWVASVWEGFTGWLTQIWTGFIAWVQSVVDGFVGWWNGVWSTVGAFFEALWAGIVAAVQLYINVVRTIIATVLSVIVGIWNGIWNGIASFFAGIWKGIVSAVQSFGGFFRSAFDGIAGFVRGAFNGVLGAIRGPINGIISLVNQAITGLNGLRVDIPDWVPGVGDQRFGLNLPRIPMLADGGTLTRAGSVLVGEEGPEILDLPRGAQVVPLERAGSGSGGVTYNVTNPDPAVVVEMLMQRMSGRLATA